VDRAGFWWRVAAVAVDLVIGGFFVVGGWVIERVILEGLDAPLGTTEYVGEMTLTLLLLVYTSSEVWLAGTPGKLVLGMTIGTAAGTEASRWTLALRWSAKWFGYLLGLVHAVTHDAASYFLAGLMNTIVQVGCLQALDEDRRAWHDEWAGTAVLRRRKAVPAGPPPLPVT
jgi:uncharacterized RDD family membrane protein YckC